MVCKHSKNLKKLEAEVAYLKKYKLQCKMLSTEELYDLAPSLKKNMAGGAIFNIDGWLNPIQLLKDIREINKANGVQFLHANIDSFNKNSSLIYSADSTDKAYEADQFVLCAGAKSAPLAKKIGIKLPIIPGKGYNLTTDVKVKNQPQLPVYMFERKVVATPWASGCRLGSTMEFAGFDNSLNRSRLSALKRASNEYLDIELDTYEMEPWAGWRPMSSTGMPIIEKSKKYGNLVIAAGHGMLGLSMAPATGYRVKELLSG